MTAPNPRSSTEKMVSRIIPALAKVGLSRSVGQAANRLATRNRTTTSTTVCRLIFIAVIQSPFEGCRMGTPHGVPVSLQLRWKGNASFLTHQALMDGVCSVSFLLLFAG